MKNFLYGAITMLVLILAATILMTQANSNTYRNIIIKYLLNENSVTSVEENGQTSGMRSKVKVTVGQTSYDGVCYSTLDFQNNTPFELKYRGELIEEVTGSPDGPWRRVFMSVGFTLPSNSRHSEVLKAGSTYFSCDINPDGMTIRTLLCELENHNQLECMNKFDWGNLAHEGL